MKLPENSLFAILLRSRWWVSMLVAVGIFAVARLFLPVDFAIFAVLPFIVISVVSMWKQLREPSGARVDAAIGAGAGKRYHENVLKGVGI